MGTKSRHQGSLYQKPVGESRLFRPCLWVCYALPISLTSIPDSHSSPQLTCKLPAGTYLVIAIDPDAPLPSLPVLGPILHWIQPGLSSERPDDPTSPLISKAPFVANYIGASPPPIGGPHKYLFMLHEQPADFDGSKFAPPGGQDLGKLARMLYTSKLEKFEKDTKLGPIIAANYFTSN